MGSPGGSPGVRRGGERGTSDFALFDGTNPANLPDAGAVCSAKSAFTYHVAVANWGPAGEVWISYSDGDFIRFPILAGGSFAFSQAAGSKGRADRAVRVWTGARPRSSPDP